MEHLLNASKKDEKLLPSLLMNGEERPQKNQKDW
jgi:hypothetical protein